MLKNQFSQIKKFLSFKKGKLILFFSVSFFCFMLFSGGVKAEMQSSNYVIYENVMHSFDGPVISGVSSNVSGQTVTITWTTSVNSDSFVVYDTDNTFVNSKEQGSSDKSSSNHSVELSGLSANTTYYYRVKSERVNGGVTTDPTERSFITGSDDSGTEEVHSGGGGILIIDKTDKKAPIIENIRTEVLNNQKVKVQWDTDEDSSSFVEYGLDENYGMTYGSWATGTEHLVNLINLIPNKTYHYRVLSSDSWGNLARSADGTFYSGEGESIPLEEEDEGEAGKEKKEENINEKIISFLHRLFPQMSLNKLGPNPIDNINNLDDIKKFIPQPILSGEPRVELGATEVKIFWNTDVEANSLVALAPEENYNAKSTEPYRQVVGNTDQLVKNHAVTLYNLNPGTVYHYQLRSKAEFGSEARSYDYSFKTNLEEIKITSFFTTIIDDQTAVFKWVTNKPADTKLKYAPYHGNVLAINESKTIKNNVQSVIHEIKIDNLVGGTFYDVELSSMDLKGNITNESLLHFSTREDDLAPILSNIKTDSTVFLDRSSKTQTIISWLTNEPATSRVYYEAGVHGANAELKEKTDLNTNYTKEHVMVITKFKPGIVYSFRVESIDSGGNVSKSSPHTFMTAKKKESIIQIIMNILENTFGWMKKLM